MAPELQDNQSLPDRFHPPGNARRSWTMMIPIPSRVDESGIPAAEPAIGGCDYFIEIRGVAFPRNQYTQYKADTPSILNAQGSNSLSGGNRSCQTRRTSCSSDTNASDVILSR